MIPKFLWSHGNSLVASFCGAVDGFDKGEAAPALDAVAGGGAILLDGLEKIFEDGLVTAKVADGCSRGAQIFVEGSGFDGGGLGIAKIGGDDSVVLEDDGAFGARDFDTARIAGVGSRSSVQNTQRAAGEFEDSSGGVFGFDLVKQSGGARLHANDVTEQPQKQIDGVNALIDQRAAAIERAVQHYITTASPEALQERLKQAALRDHDLDLEVASDWLAVDQEQWRKLDNQEERHTNWPKEAKSTSRRSVRP
jgi:hypothetical protein